MSYTEYPITHEEYTKGPGPWDHIDPGNHDHESTPESKREAFQDPNGFALGVNQRSSKEWQGFSAEVQGYNNFQPAKLIDRQAGRKQVLIFVPGSAPAGIYIDSGNGSLQVTSGPLGFHLPVGGSVTLDTEAPIWATSDSATINTVVSVAVFWG